MTITPQELKELRATIIQFTLGPNPSPLTRTMFNNLPALLNAWDEREKLKSEAYDEAVKLVDTKKKLAAASAEIDRLKADLITVRAVRDAIAESSKIDRDAAIAEIGRLKIESIKSDARQKILCTDWAEDHTHIQSKLTEYDLAHQQGEHIGIQEMVNIISEQRDAATVEIERLRDILRQIDRTHVNVATFELEINGKLAAIARAERAKELLRTCRAAMVENLQKYNHKNEVILYAEVSKIDIFLASEQPDVDPSEYAKHASKIGAQPVKFE